MTALFALIRKDLLLFMGDRRALLVNLIMPVVLGAFFGYVTGGSGRSDNAKIEVAVVVQDDSALAAKVLADLKGEKALLVSTPAEDEAKELVRKGKIKAAMVIPQGFGKAAGSAMFGGAKKPEITLYYDPSQQAVLAMVKGVLTQYVMQAVGADMFGGTGGLRMVAQGLASMQQQGDTATNPQRAELRDMLQSMQKVLQRSASASAAGGTTTSPGSGGLSTPFVTQDVAMTSGPRYNGYAHSFAGMAVQFILFMGVDAGITVLLARRLGLWSRLRVAPVSLNTILMARMLSCAIIAFVLMLLIFAAAYVLFGVHISGSMLGFLGICASFALVTGTFGLLIAAFGRTPEAARGIAVFVTLIMVMLGGAWVPSFFFPQWLQDLALGVPTRWAVDGLDATTWRGLGLDVAGPAMAVQLGFAALFGALALWKFGRDAKQ